VVQAFSAEGKTTDFMINHGVQTSPTNVTVTPISKDAVESFYIYAITGDYFILRYLRPPPPAIPPGSDNIVVSWSVKA
jgi:hypothetical protein